MKQKFKIVNKRRGRTEGELGAVAYLLLGEMAMPPPLDF